MAKRTTSSVFEVKNSSRVKSFSYEKNTLTVTFTNNNQSYRYFKVPDEVLQQLVKAVSDVKSSFGKAFQELIIKGGYKYEKID